MRNKTYSKIFGKLEGDCETMKIFIRTLLWRQNYDWMQDYYDDFCQIINIGWWRNYSIKRGFALEHNVASY